MNVLLTTKSPFCAVPTGLRGNCWCRHPALKRWANEHCAYGAAEIRNSQVDLLDSCDCPGVRRLAPQLAGRSSLQFRSYQIMGYDACTCCQSSSAQYIRRIREILFRKAAE